MSLLYWYPEYGIGMVGLTNRLPHPVLDDLALGLTDKLVRGKLIKKRFPQPEPDYHGCSAPGGAGPSTEPTPYKSDWRRYCGTHNLQFSEYSLEWWAHVAILIVGRDEYTPRIHVHEKDGFLCVTESKFFEQVSGVRSVDERLQEVRPGVFTTQGGGHARLHPRSSNLVQLPAGEAINGPLKSPEEKEAAEVPEEHKEQGR